MLAHVIWSALLYVALTVARAPDVWRVGARPDGTNPLAAVEQRISANLSNQFEWPVLYYVASLLAIVAGAAGDPVLLWLAWIFVGGRIAHSLTQIFTTNIRARGLVFTVNFVAVIAMWIRLLAIAA